MGQGQDTLKGAAGGAMVGSALLPGWGTAIGAGVGGLVGFFGSNSDEEDAYSKKLKHFMDSGLPYEQAQQSALRATQVEQLTALKAMQEGRGPSLAQAQMRDAMHRAQASQQALAGSAVGRGVGPGGAYRNAASTTGAMQQQGARDTGMMRAAEQMQAMQQYTQALHGARGQDENLNTFNAQQRNELAYRERLARMQALGMGAPGPSIGDQLLAGGSSAFGMMGGRGGGNGQGNAVAQNQGGGNTGKGYYTEGGQGGYRGAYPGGY